MRDTNKKALMLLSSALWMMGMQSCRITHGALYAEKQIARDVYKAACGINNFDPCHPNPELPVCGPGEFGVCQAPTCTDGHVTHLSLSCDQLVKVPPEIGQLSRLETLDVSSKQAFSLPAEISELTDLEVLNMSGNQLASLPAEIGKIPNLRILILRNSQLTSLPPEIGQLATLEQLDLSGNQLTDLPAEIGKLSQLRILNLHGSHLETLPLEIGQLVRLEELDLSGSQLINLPAELGRLSQLRNLNLHENKLASLPAEIGQLASLKELDLSNNWLTSLPMETGQLSNLENLNLLDNQLSDLPKEIGQLSHLARLDINRNPFNGPMPIFLMDLPLEYFNYSITGLCVPDDHAFQGWRFGGYWMCSEATKLPEAERVALTSLYEKVGLDESWHPGVPPCRWVGVNCWNGHARNIQLINWISQELTQLPVEVTQLSQLESLELDGNKLNALPPEFERLETLTRLTLNNNRFTSIPPEIGRLYRLTYLDVSGNPLDGPIPDVMTELSLWFFYFQDTGLCIPNNEMMRTWLDGLMEHSNGTACLP